MDYILIYTYLLSLVALGFIFPRSKWIHILLVFNSFSFFTLSYDDWDRLAYMDAYENVSLGLECNYEYLYVLLMRICSMLGITFEGFRYVTAFISLSGLEYASLKFSKYRNIVWASYLVYPVMFDATLIRTSLAMGIIAFSIVKLIYSKTIRDYIVCCFWVIVATLIHKSSFVFFVFIPFWYYLRQGFNRLRFFVICLFFFIIETTSAYLFSTIGQSLAGKSANYYDNLYQGNIIFNTIMYILYISPVLVLWPNRVFKSNFTKTKIEGSILKINLLFLFVLIPQFYIAFFSRVFKILFFFNYIYLSRCAELPKWKVVALPYTLLYSVTLLSLRLLLYPDMIPTILMMHLRTNVILDLFRF